MLVVNRTITAGSISNYLFASILMFFGFMLGGNPVVDEASMRIATRAGGPAATAGMHDGDKILSVQGEAIKDWDQLKKTISAHPGEKLDIEVERGSEHLHLFPMPAADGDLKGKIQIGPETKILPVSAGQAAILSVKEPPKVVYALVKGLGRRLPAHEDFPCCAATDSLHG